MSALSIRHMNFTLRERELESARRDAADYEAMPAEMKAETLHYWWIERKVIKTTKRGVKVEWKWERDLWATKKDAAAFCIRYGVKGDRRLHHRYEFGKEIRK